jgi:hypothetical protein
MYEAYDRGDKAGFKFAGYKIQDDKEGRKFNLNLGSRESPTYTRFYNHIWKTTNHISNENLIQIKELNSRDNDNLESYRYEVEFHKKKAEKVVSELLKLFEGSGQKPNVGIWKGRSQIEEGDRVWVELEQDYGTVIKWDDNNECFEVELSNGAIEVYYPNQLVSQSFNEKVANKIAYLCIGQVDFVAKSRYKGKRKSANKGDCKRLDFWQKVIDTIGGAIKITVTRTAPTMERSLNWMKWGVSGMLATFYEGLGEADFWMFIAYLLGEGKSRMQDRHYMMADAVADDLMKGKFDFLV